MVAFGCLGAVSLQNYLPQLIPLMLNVLHSDPSQRRIHSMKILHSLRLIDVFLEPYSHLVIPALARLFELSEFPDLQKEVLRIISLSLSLYLSRARICSLWLTCAVRCLRRLW
jgi:hypothetical protein